MDVSFLSGGSILHDHFDARPYNIEVIKRFGLRRFFVCVRDPRAAAFSLTNRNEKFGVKNAGQQYFDLYQVYISWLTSWCAAAEREDVEIEWITNTEFVQGSMYEKIARDFPEFSDPSTERKLVKANFGRG
jgi:hypothetical protein